MTCTSAARCHRLDLSGTWRLDDDDGRVSADDRVPGDVHSALLAAGIIPDPYVGTQRVRRALGGRQRLDA